MYQVENNTYPAGPETTPRSPPPDSQRPPSGLPSRTWDVCPSAWTARWTGDARDAPAREKAPRRAPEVTREWPAETRRHAIEPLDAPILVMAASSLAAPLALLVPRIDDRGGILLAALLVYLCVAGILLIASAWTLTPEERALRRAERDIRGGEPPGRIVPRLRRVDLRGRPRLHRDLAVRCLERSELSHVQERVLREQAGMWIEKARDGLRKEVRE